MLLRRRPPSRAAVVCALLACADGRPKRAYLREPSARRVGVAVAAGLDLGVSAEGVQELPALLHVLRDGAVFADVGDVVRVLVPHAARRDPTVLRVSIDGDDGSCEAGAWRIADDTFGKERLQRGRV